MHPRPEACAAFIRSAPAERFAYPYAFAGSSDVPNPYTQPLHPPFILVSRGKVNQLSL